MPGTKNMLITLSTHSENIFLKLFYGYLYSYQRIPIKNIKLLQFPPSLRQMLL